MIVDPKLAAEILLLDQTVVDMIAELDRIITGPNVPPEAVDLVGRAQETAQQLIVAVERMGDMPGAAEARRHAQEVASYVTVLARDIRGGAVH